MSSSGETCETFVHTHDIWRLEFPKRKTPAYFGARLWCRRGHLNTFCVLKILSAFCRV